MRDRDKTKEQLIEELARTRRRLAQLEAGNGSPGDEELWFRERAIAASRNGIVITDPNQPDNPIVYVNPAFERMTGYTAEEIAGRNCRFLQGSTWDQPPLDVLRAALEEGRDCKVVLQNYRKDGSPFWNELSVSPVRDEQGRLVNFVGVLDDVTARKRTEEKLRRNEERLKIALQTGGLGSWELDLLTGELRSSDVCKANFGLPPGAEFSYRDLFEAIHPDDRTLVRKKVERAVEDHTDYEAEYRNIWPDGSIHWISVRGRVIHGSDGKSLCMVGMTLDITEHKQAEDMLREDGERLSSIIAIQQEIASAKLELNTVMSLVAERLRNLLGSDGAAVELVEGDELVYQAASGTVAPYLGLRLKVDSSLSGWCVRRGELMHSEDTETDERVDRDICRRIGARSMIVVPLHHDRQTVGVLKVLSARPNAFDERDIDAVQLMIGLIAAGMSHTAEFEAERAMVEQRTAALARIQASEARFRTTFEGAPVGMALVDPDGRLLESNPALRTMLGYSATELGEMKFSDITHPEDVAVGVDLYRELVAGEREGYELEKRYLRKDGQTLWGRLKVSLVWDSEDNGAFAIGMVEDVTERKRAEEALFEIREAERRRIARDLHDGVLQDISGALQAMQAFQLEAGGSDDDGVDQTLDALRRAVGGLRGAIYDLRQSREQPLAREVESLVELNRQMEPEREMALAVDEGFPEELPETLSLEVLRIVQEVLVNVRRHSDARRARVSLSVGVGEVCASVSDNGRGFDVDATPEGIGISVMRERAIAAGGKLEVLSKPGKGTLVTVRVPFG